MAILDFLFGDREVEYPQQKFSMPSVGKLRQESGTLRLPELAEQRIRAGITGEDTPGVGFGQDFLSKSTNPVVKDRLRRLTEQTIPKISSDYSARGIGRSNLASNAVQRADRDTQNEIDQLISKFYVLDQAQRKTDISEGIRAGQSNQAFEQGVNRDIVSGDQFNRQAQYGADTQNAKINQADVGALISILGSAAAPFTGGASLGTTKAGNDFFKSATSSSSANILGASQSSLPSFQDVDLLSSYFSL